MADREAHPTRDRKFGLKESRPRPGGCDLLGRTGLRARQSFPYSFPTRKYRLNRRFSRASIRDSMLPRLREGFPIRSAWFALNEFARGAIESVKRARAVKGLHDPSGETHARRELRKR